MGVTALLRGGGWLLLALLALPAAAADFAVDQVTLEKRQGEWLARARWTAPWQRPPFRQVREGVPVEFTMEFRVFRRRSWWYDARVATVRARREVYYNRLTRQYRIIDRRSGERHFTRDWARARALVQRCGPLPLIDSERLGEGDYYVAVRVRASQERLSLPARVLTTLTGGWRGVSEWRYHPLTP